MIGEAHRSAPTVIGSEGTGRVRVTMSLSRAHAPWPTITYVTLHLAGLDVDFGTVSGNTVLTAEHAADVGRGLVHLAGLALECER